MTDARGHWLYEDGVGEARAMLVEHGRPVELHVERPDAIRVGDVLAARIVRISVGGQVFAEDERQRRFFVRRLAQGMSEGREMRLRVTREAVAERGRAKFPHGVPTEEAPRRGPSLRERIEASGIEAATCHASGPDRLAEHGWDELVDAARTGRWEFSEGGLLLDLTPAMTVIDVDGDGRAGALAKAAAVEVARVIRLFGLAGNIGIDLPTMREKAERADVLAAFDEAMKVACERTAPNGFGFMQVVTKRERASLPEQIARSPIRAAMLAMLRRAERARGAGALRLRCHPAVAVKLAREAALVDELGSRLGRPVHIEGRAMGGPEAYDIANEVER